MTGKRTAESKRAGCEAEAILLTGLAGGRKYRHRRGKERLKRGEGSCDVRWEEASG